MVPHENPSPFWTSFNLAITHVRTRNCQNRQVKVCQERKRIRMWHQIRSDFAANENNGIVIYVAKKAITKIVYFSEMIMMKWRVSSCHCFRTVVALRLGSLALLTKLLQQLSSSSFREMFLDPNKGLTYYITENRNRKLILWWLEDYIRD